MNIIFLDLSPAYIPFLVQCTTASGAKSDPTADNLIIYEEGGADGTFDSGTITGSPFNPAQVNSKTGLWGVLVAKSAFTAGKWYIALWEMTVDGVTTAKVERYFACNFGTAQTGDSYARLGAPAGASVSADIAAIPANVIATVGPTGVLQSLVTITDNPTTLVIRGDVKLLTFSLGTAWNLTGRTAYFCMKRNISDANSDAVVNRACTVTDAANGVCTITLTAAETRAAGMYEGEVEVRDTTTEANPGTAWQGKIEIAEDVRK